MIKYIKKKPKKFKRKQKDNFYRSKEWKQIRYEKLKEINYCECCGKTKKDKAEGGGRLKLTVDHIISRSVDPKLELSYDNLQVLCWDCHQMKKKDDHTDFRTKPEQP